MPKPLIAIVGRPNVGKSTLFNRLVGRRDAIVDPTPGVTRDRHYGEATLLGRPYQVVDTGGFDPEASERGHDDAYLPLLREQAAVAVAEADLVIAVYDGRDGLTPVDREIARELARSDRPVLHAVNKIDGPGQEALTAEFWELGVPELYPLSATHGEGVLDLAEVVVEAVPAPEAEEDPAEASDETRVAVIGRPNVGKSTLVNRLLGEARQLVSEEPGTTRDSIDSVLELPPEAGAVAEAEARLEALREELAADGEPFEGPPAPPEAAAPVAEDEEALADEADEALGDDGVLVHYAPDEAGEVEEPDDELGGGEPPRASGPDVEDRRWTAPASSAREHEETLAAAREAVERARQPRRYRLVDTAGIRRRRSIDSRLERVSALFGFRSLARADVALLLVDAEEGATDQDGRLASLIADEGRACVLLVNKWDALPDKDSGTAGRWVYDLREDLPQLSWAPIEFVSAQTGKRVQRLPSVIDRVRRNHLRRVPTGPLNRFLAEVVRRHQPPVRGGRRLKIYYMTQVATAPPTFVLWLNNPDALHFSYRRFLVNRLREAWDFEGTPIRLLPRTRGGRR